MKSFLYVILSGLGCTILKGYYDKKKMHNTKSRKTITIIPTIHNIAKDLKDLYSTPVVQIKSRNKIDNDITKLDTISVHIQQNFLNKHLLFIYSRQDLNWIHDSLNTLYHNNLCPSYSLTIKHFNKAYKNIFRGHKKGDKYEI